MSDFRHSTSVRCFGTLDIQLSFPSSSWDKLWVGAGVGIGLAGSVCFWAVNVVPGSNIKSHIEFKIKSTFCRLVERLKKYFPVKHAQVIFVFPRGTSKCPAAVNPLLIKSSKHEYLYARGN